LTWRKRRRDTETWGKRKIGRKGLPLGLNYLIGGVDGWKGKSGKKEKEGKRSGGASMGKWKGPWGPH